MTQEYTPLFIPIVSFPDHCRSLSLSNLRPLTELIHEMEFKFYKAEKLLGIMNFVDTPYEVLDLKGIHVRLLDSVLKLRLVPLFDWQSWRLEAENYYAQPTKLYGLDAETLGKIMTVLLRSQSLYDANFLETKIKDRFVLHLLKAVVQSIETGRFSSPVGD
ncbi:MAG TPA: DUF6508 domain-containing protein [Lunatimonas sp.]|nr:DUF6508 domain-containing protein [Lunatimonas sp.]